MFKKLITLAATTAMFGANAAAQAISTARTVVKSVTGSSPAGEEAKPGDGTRIQPSIPAMPPIEKAEKTEKNGKSSTRAGQGVRQHGDGTEGGTA